MRHALLLLPLLLLAPDARASTLAEQNEALFRQLREVHQLSDAQLAQVKALFARAGHIGQGNPAITKHPVSVEDCQAKLQKEGVDYRNAAFEKTCGGPYMAPLYDPSSTSADKATTCIDQFEFPNAPCAYPVVWVRAKEAAELCQIMGKRLCDAHEWEGACAGSLQPPDYRFDLVPGKAPAQAVSAMRAAHNRAHEPSKSWSYGGTAYQKGTCAGASFKSPACDGGNWHKCGSNTYPTGFFPGCRSSLQVFDLHGNAAEHMNLPLTPEQMSSRGSKELGYTEMKGSWFIFDRTYAHDDWCRWRAPYWHGSRVMAANSHHNYHLGFRCCKTVE